jgi:hypothetical protein
MVDGVAHWHRDHNVITGGWEPCRACLVVLATGGYDVFYHRHNAKPDTYGCAWHTKAPTASPASLDSPNLRQ